MNIDFQFYSETLKGDTIVRMEKVKKIAKEFSCTLKEVEIEFLARGITPLRYIGNVRAFGTDGQKKLLQSTACIIGCGGLGGSIIELCGRLGIGKLILADGDRFDESNLNRQLLSTEELVGRSKVECAAARVYSLNPAIEVEIHNTYINDENVHSIIQGSHVVIDGLDNAKSRITLQDSCRDLSIPMVHGAIGNTLLHVTSILPGDNSIDKLYSRDVKNGTPHIFGNPAVTVFLCAALEVSEALKILLNKGEILKDKLLNFDWLYDDFNIINL